MSRYVDADTFDDTVLTLNAQGWGITRGEYKLMDSVLFEMPTADVVEVVRCKHCEYHNSASVCKRMNRVMKDDEFCSYGERRKE